jgi:hypothetical protein
MNFDETEFQTYEIPGVFALLRKEIRNGSITSSFWEIISKVDTNHEIA